ncbi:MAG: hypothetical protein ACOVRM_11380, partial [Planctomycetaceae bacterium]
DEKNGELGVSQASSPTAALPAGSPERLLPVGFPQFVPILPVIPIHAKFRGSPQHRIQPTFPRQIHGGQS